MTQQENGFKIICENKIPKIKKFIRGRNVYIWGAGQGGKIVEIVCRENGIKVSGFCDKRAKKIKEYLGYSVYELEEMNPMNDYLILSFMTFQYDVPKWIREIGYTYSDCFYIYENEGYNKEDIIYRGCKVGRYTYGYESFLSNCPLAEVIGRYCSINMTARIWNNHPTEYVTTHPFLDYSMFYGWENYESRERYTHKYGKFFNNAEFEKSELRDNQRVHIGNDVWIGANVVILPGITIGDGAIIAAGAVVVKNVEPYAIVGGVPAKTIKYRFDQGEIQLLEKIKWWDWTIEEIEKNIELFYQPKEFLKQRYYTVPKDIDKTLPTDT